MIDAIILLGTNTTGSGRSAIAAICTAGTVPLLLTNDPRRHAEDQGCGATLVEVPSYDNERALVAICRRLASAYRVKAVTTFSDPRVAMAALLARALNLPGPDPAAVRRCADKWRQARALMAAGIPAPETHLVRDQQSLAAAIEALGTPAIVKPRTGSGSVGVRIAANAVDAAAMAFNLIGSAAAGQPADVLLQRYIDGPQYSVELFNAVVVGITRNYIDGPPTCIESGHDFPAAVSSVDADRLAAAAVHSIATLGLRWGAAHVELRLDRADAFVIEVNPRLAGGMIPELVRLSTGIDLVQAAISAACGEPIALIATYARAAALRSLIARERGTIRHVAAAPDDPHVRFVEIRHAGDQVGFGDFRDRVGYVIAHDVDMQDAADLADHALRQIELRMHPRDEEDTPCTTPAA